MISLTSEPEVIKDGETLKIKLNIQGQINKSMYKGTYFNLIIKKNGAILGPITLYPLRYNGFPIEWEVNPNSYGSYGTFPVMLQIQDGRTISNTTFIVEPNCVIGKINTCNNITAIEYANKLKTLHVTKKEIPIDHTGGCLIQKPGVFFLQEEIIKEEPVNLELRTELISSVKVQKINKNVNGK